MASDRFYSFNIVTYHTDLDIIKSFCDKTFKFAYILHDKDEGKSPHFHILCSFKSNLSFNSVRKFFPDNQNTIIQQLFDRLKSFEYLYHKNDPDKFQYDIMSIVTNDLKYFSLDKSSEKLLERAQFYDDLKDSSGLTERDLFLKYGRDYIKNRRVYRDFVRRAENQLVDIDNGYPDYSELLSYADFLGDLMFSYSQIHPWVTDGFDSLTDLNEFIVLVKDYFQNK